MKRKKKKLDGVAEVAKTVQDKGGDALMAGVAGTLTLLGGAFGASKIPDLEIAKKIPVVGEYVAKSFPAIAMLGISAFAAMQSNDKKVQAGAIGLAIAGVIDGLRRNGVFSKVLTVIPAPGFNGPAALPSAQPEATGYNLLNGLGAPANSTYQLLN